MVGAAVYAPAPASGWYDTHMVQKRRLTVVELAERLSEEPAYEPAREDAAAIVRKAIGSRPDLPPGEELLLEVRYGTGTV